MMHGHLRGALCVGAHATAGSLTRLDMDLLEELAALTGEVLTHHESRELFRGDSQAEIGALVRALADADGDTYRHSLEVAATARAIAKRLGLRTWTSWRSSSERCCTTSASCGCRAHPPQARPARRPTRLT